MSYPSSAYFLKNKRILITGATGFIGASLSRRLVKSEVKDIHVFCRKHSDKWRIKDIERKLCIHRIDLREYIKLRKLILKIKPQFIFHCAVYGGFSHQKNENDILTTNINGTMNLINSLSGINYDSFINAGSSSEYGIKNKKMTEKDVLNPVSLYGLTKAFSTIYAGRVAGKKNKPITTIRPFSVYGPYESEDRLIASFILEILKGKKEFKIRSASAVRDFIYIDDVIDFFIKIARTKKSLGVLNIGSGKQYSVRKTIKEIKETAESNIKIIWQDDKKKRCEPEKWIADMSKAKKMLSWNNKTDFKTGIKKTILWMKKNRRLYEKKD